LAVSYDKGDNWVQFTDTLQWNVLDEVSNKANGVLEVGIICDSVMIGLFTNPNYYDKFFLQDFFWTKFSNANTGTITNLPNTIYNGGKYAFLVTLNFIELPDMLILEKSYDGKAWEYFDYLTKGDIGKNWIFENNNRINEDVYFRVVYNSTWNEYTLAQSSKIPYLVRDTYLNFTSSGGYKILNESVNITWSKSENFGWIYFRVNCNDTTIFDTPLHENYYNLNFEKPGKYKVTIIAKDNNFVIEKSILFNVVEDPCLGLVIENKALWDSIYLYRKEIGRKDSILSQYAEVITKKNLRIEQLELFIIDSTTYNLVFKEGDITSLKDTKYAIDIKLISPIDNYIILPYDNSITYWLFSVSGKLIEAKTGFNINKIDINNFITGTYLLYVKENNSYTLYKFIKN
jgi:hypothetical protein